mgnify:CR=1 FL=1
MSKEEIVSEGKLDEVIIETTTRQTTGRRRIIFNYENCPTRAEQHGARETDINYLMKKYQPDELAAYLATRKAERQEIIGHDFSQEPDRQGALNFVVRMRQAYENLPEDLKRKFNNHVDFLKFIDNPKNAEKMEKLGILTKKEIKTLQSDPDPKQTTPPPKTPTKEKDDKKKEDQ